MEDLALQIPEGFLPLIGKYLGHCTAGHLLYECVAVQVWIFQCARHYLPHCALPTASRLVSEERQDCL